MRSDVVTARDADLVAAVREGDHSALEVLFRRHHAACLGLARRVVVNAHLAEEIGQEAFLRLWNDPDRFDAERRVAAFVPQLDRRQCGDRRRSLGAGAPLTRGTRRPPSRSRCVRRGEREAVQRALLALSDDERAAITLAYSGGHTYRQVAQLLAQPEGTVKSRIRSGLHRLERELRSQRVAA